MKIDTKELRSFHGWAARTDSERLDMLRAAADCIDSQAAEIERLRTALAEISEYWNRDQNDQAMHDACWHAINTANSALSGEQT